uniref:Endo/exonuclease/phosphatase domain-containing protein n=1 Tax=Steinernema glaseri TaxID=37863 RepID=A0A1I7Z6R7_9BILA
DLSTYHTKEGMNPDFIFYSVASTKLDRSVLQVKEAGLRLVRRLELPDISEANATFGPWPHAYTPSDHVPLLVDFAFV